MYNSTRMKQQFFSIVAASSMVFAACADLVGLYTFDGADPLDAVIGVPAYEGVCPENKKPPVLSDILQTITLVTDPDVLEAISYHNTGYPGMTRLDMCVCLSDSIEPLREAYPRLEQIRALAETSLERALLLSLEGTADFVTSRGKYLHPRTQNTIAWLKRSLSEAR